MSYTITHPFDTPENYVFGTDIEIIGGVAKLLPIVSGAEVALDIRFDENFGVVALDSSGNGIHGAFTGGYTENQWVPGKINTGIKGLSTSAGFINFNHSIEFEYNEPFSFSFWVKFTSSATQAVLSRQINTGINEGLAINLLTGKLRCNIKDVSSNIIAIESVSTYNDGLWHHIVFTYDGGGVVGGLNLYIDNVVDRFVVISNTLSATITNTANFQISGRDGSNLCLDSATVIDLVRVFYRELTFAEISFLWNGGAGTQQIPGASTSFSTSNPYLLPASSFNATQVLNMLATITAVGGDSISFIILVNNVDMYWNGAAWAISTGYPQSNTLAEIQANISTLDLLDGRPIKYKAIFHSATGATTPELSLVGFVFDSFTSLISGPNQCNVFGFIFDDDNNPVEGSVVTITPSKNIGVYNGVPGIVYLNTKKVVTDVNGKWEVTLTETDNLSDIFYTFVFNYSGSSEMYKRGVPDLEEINFSLLTES